MFSFCLKADQSPCYFFSCVSGWSDGCKENDRTNETAPDSTWKLGGQKAWEAFYEFRVSVIKHACDALVQKVRYCIGPKREAVADTQPDSYITRHGTSVQ